MNGPWEKYQKQDQKEVGPWVKYQEKPTDWKQVIGDSLKASLQKPAAFAKDLGTNPVSMANAMPPVLGTAGGFSPVPGGATMGTLAGQGIRDLALGAMKKPIPGLMQHGLELGGAALGDAVAIPMIKKNIFGSQIGDAEKAAGVITRAPTKSVTPGSVGETLNNLEAQLDAGTIRTAQEAKDAKAVVNQIYKNPKIYEQTGDISVQAARVSQKTQKLLNEMIPGRLQPAQSMAKAMTIPNAITKGYASAPWALRHGAEGAVGAGIGWKGLQILKSLLGLGR